MEAMTDIEHVTEPGHFLTLRLGPFKSATQAEMVETAICAYLSKGLEMKTEVLLDLL